MTKEFCFIFRAKDYEKTVDFYRNQLECPVIQDWDRGPTQKGTVIHLGGMKVEMLAATPDKEPIQAKGFELSIEVDDVNTFYQFVKGKGIAIFGEIADKPWGQRAFSVKDPNGIKIIFYTDL
jgi:catechol 2,3-dioxygenase-like lactoylglutathione lyase family enzyme